MSALKDAVLHLLHLQTQSDQPGAAQIAKRHHEAVSAESEPEPVYTTLEVTEIDPDQLHKNIEAMVHRLAELKPFEDGQRIQTTVFPQTETVTYQDGSSASGPGPLPRVSTSGSPAVTHGPFPVVAPGFGDKLKSGLAEVAGVLAVVAENKN